MKKEGIEVSYDPMLLDLMDYTDKKSAFSNWEPPCGYYVRQTEEITGRLRFYKKNSLSIDKKIELLQDYLRFLARQTPINEEERQGYKRLIKSYQIELEYLKEERKNQQLDKERLKYHSDNYWDTAFDIYHSDQSLTWPKVYERMSVRMKELGLEITKTKGSFESRRKVVQKNRLG